MKEKADLFNLLPRVREIVTGPLGRDEKLKAICILLRGGVDHYDWVGFYIVDESKQNLLLGPYVGEPTRHTEIPFGQGVCGRAAKKKRTLAVQDVSKVLNYLSYSPEVQAEIVVPIFKNGELVGELDIDSHTLAAFTKEDKTFLEDVCKVVSELFIEK